MENPSLEPLPRTPPSQHEVNSEEPLDLIMLLNERLQSSFEERKQCDVNLMTRFSRKGCTAVVIVIHIADDAVEVRPRRTLAPSTRVSI